MTELSTPLIPSNVGGMVWSGSGDEGGGRSPAEWWRTTPKNNTVGPFWVVASAKS